VGAEENLQVVRTYFATVGRAEEGAVQRAIAEMTDDVVWHIPKSLPNGGAHEGRDAVLAMLDANDGVSLYQPGSMDVQVATMIADDEHVVVPLHLRAITGRGEPYENDYVFIFRIRDGRIAEVWENLDTLYLHTKLHV